MAKSKSPALKMNDERREIAVNALISHALRDRYVEMAKRERGLFDAAYTKLITPEQLKIMAKLPQEFFLQERSLYVRAGEVGWDGHVASVKPESIKVQYQAWRRGHLHVVVHSEFDAFPMPYKTRRDRLTFHGEMSVQIQNFLLDQKKLREESDELLRQLMGTIAGFKHVDDLIDAIPELKELAPGLFDVVEKQKALVPDVKGVMCKIASLRGEERAGCAEIPKAA